MGGAIVAGVWFALTLVIYQGKRCRQDNSPLSSQLLCQGKLTQGIRNVLMVRRARTGSDADRAAALLQRCFCLDTPRVVMTSRIEPQTWLGCGAAAEVKKNGSRWAVLCEKNKSTIGSCQKMGHTMFTRKEAIRVWNELK